MHILSTANSQLPIIELLHEKVLLEKTSAASTGPNIPSRLQKSNINIVCKIIRRQDISRNHMHPFDRILWYFSNILLKLQGFQCKTVYAFLSIVKMC
jgi:hypothetical protein